MRGKRPASFLAVPDGCVFPIKGDQQVKSTDGFGMDWSRSFQIRKFQADPQLSPRSQSFPTKTMLTKPRQIQLVYMKLCFLCSATYIRCYS